MINILCNFDWKFLEGLINYKYVINIGAGSAMVSNITQAGDKGDCELVLATKSTDIHLYTPTNQ